MTDQYLREFERWVAGPKTRKAQLRAELEEHLRAAQAAGDTEALARLGTPREAAEAFAEGYEPPIANPWRRVVAGVADFLSIFLFVALVGLLLWVFSERWVEGTFVLGWLVGMGWWIVGLTLLEWRTGKTPGKAALGLRVMSESGTAPSFGQVLVRRLTLFFSGPLQLIDWMVMFFSHKHQRGLDMLAKTLVVLDQREEVPHATAPVNAL